LLFIGRRAEWPLLPAQSRGRQDKEERQRLLRLALALVSWRRVWRAGQARPRHRFRSKSDFPPIPPHTHLYAILSTQRYRTARRQHGAAAGAVAAEGAVPPPTLPPPTAAAAAAAGGAGAAAELPAAAGVRMYR